MGNRLALRRVVSNLIDNALFYGKNAHVALSTDAGQAVLEIDDEGPGIPLDKRRTILEPFARLDRSRNRATGGAGLGLAVARNLAEAHGGSIEIADGPRGARVIVRIPRLKRKPPRVYGSLAPTASA
jgi:signal transduction histidine kinase